MPQINKNASDDFVNRLERSQSHGRHPFEIKPFITLSWQVIIGILFAYINNDNFKKGGD
jgi:hypothetical protein